MNKITKYIFLTCLTFAGYESTGVVYADASSMKALAGDAAEKARECKLGGLKNRKAGLETKWADECNNACGRAYKDLSDSNRKLLSQEQQLDQMEHCKRAYDNYKSPPEIATFEDEIIPMPATLEEMATQMSAMKRKGKSLRNPCLDGEKAIRQRGVGFDQAKYFWDRCVQQYKMDLKMRRDAGR